MIARRQFVTTWTVEKQSFFFDNFSGCRVTDKANESSASCFIRQNARQEIIDSGTAVTVAIDCGRLLSYEIFGVEVVKLAGLQIDNSVWDAEKFVVPIEVVGNDKNGIARFEQSYSRAEDDARAFDL